MPNIPDVEPEGALRDVSMEKMQATVFHGVNDIRVEEVERPRASVGEAVIRVTLTTICGTDLHILRGEYPIKPGLIIGHEPVGVIAELGDGVAGYSIGDRVLVGAITVAVGLLFYRHARGLWTSILYLTGSIFED